MKHKKFDIFVIISFLLVVIAITIKPLQNDTFYYIKIGEDILKNGIDFLDHYSIHNLEYLYPHWLFDIILFKVYDIGGFAGIYIFTIFLFYIFSMILYYGASKFSKNKLISFLLIFTSLFTFKSMFSARSQAISTILFLIEWLLIEKYMEKKDKKILMYLIMILLLIFYTHMAVWPLFYVFFLPYIAEYIVSKFKIKGINNIVIKTNNNIIDLVKLIPFSLLLGLLTPQKLDSYTYIFKTLQGSTTNFISEHLPIQNFEYPLFLIILFLITFSFLIKNFNYRLRDLFFIAGFTFMTILSKRHLVFLLIAFVLCFGRSLSNYLNYKESEDILNYFNKPLIFVLSIFIVSIISYQNYNKESKYLYNITAPKKVVQYIKKNIDQEDMRLYNQYDVGAYLLFNDIKVFIDSRCDLYTREYNKMDRSIYDDQFLNGFDYEELMDYYDITHVLLLNSKDITHVIKKDSNYKQIFQDENYVLFKRLNTN